MKKLVSCTFVFSFFTTSCFGYSLSNDLLFAEQEESVIAQVDVEESKLPPESKPWTELPNPQDFMRECFVGIQKVVQVVTQGWQIEGITCSQKSGVVVSWRKEWDSLPDIEQALNESGVKFSSRVLSRDGNTVMVSVPIGEITKLNSPPQFNEEDLINIINDLNQTLDINISLAPKTWVSPRGTIYKLMAFTITSNIDPLNWSDLLMKFSGLTVDTVTYDINSGNWTYKGEIYIIE